MTTAELYRTNSASLVGFDFQPSNQWRSAFIDPRPTWLEGFRRQIAAISDVEKYHPAANRAFEFLRDHAPETLIPPAVTVGDDYSIQIEWHNDLVDLEIEFYADQDPEAYVLFSTDANSTMGPLREDLGDDGRVYRAFQKTMEAAAA